MSQAQLSGVSGILSQCHVKKAFALTLVITVYFTVKSLVIVSNLPQHRDGVPETTMQKWTTMPRNPTTSPTVEPWQSWLTSNCSEDDLLGTPRGIKDKDCNSCKNITCKDLLFGTEGMKIYDRVRAFMAKHHFDKFTDLTLLQATNDCKKFISDHGYHTKPGSKEEEDFPIAYNIIVHRESDMVERLLRAIYHPQNVYCIHVDLKSSPDFQTAIKSLAKCFPNVFITSKLERIVYAGFTRLQADINCMKDLINHEIKWKYLINTAGQAFPLKSNAEMVKVLNIYNGSNDVEGIYGPRIIKGRFVNEWQELYISKDFGKVNKTGRMHVQPPHDIDIVRGSAYGIFSRDFVNYILADKKAQDLLNWSRKTYSPDEHYWATLHHTYSNPHLHPPGGYSGEPNEKPWLAVFVAWGGVHKCHGMWRRGTCVFGVEDLPLLVRRKEFMANKFHSGYQPIVLDCLGAWIEYKSQCPPAFDYNYYQKLPFINKPR